jgi:hypothetical protein
VYSSYLNDLVAAGVISSPVVTWDITNSAKSIVTLGTVTPPTPTPTPPTPTTAPTSTIYKSTSTSSFQLSSPFLYFGDDAVYNTATTVSFSTESAFAFNVDQTTFTALTTHFTNAGLTCDTQYCGSTTDDCTTVAAGNLFNMAIQFGTEVYSIPPAGYLFASDWVPSVTTYKC